MLWWISAIHSGAVKHIKGRGTVNIRYVHELCYGRVCCLQASGSQRSRSSWYTARSFSCNRASAMLWCISAIHSGAVEHIKGRGTVNIHYVHELCQYSNIFDSKGETRGTHHAAASVQQGGALLSCPFTPSFEHHGRTMIKQMVLKYLERTSPSGVPLR